ncbi:MAG: hypothetical protein K6E52_00340 [Bacteroidaceae bacterium]|nr:hypothetical protein [Bacteroidaceae bacterium]
MEKQKNGAMEKGHIHPRGYWTLERVIEESQKYQKRVISKGILPQLMQLLAVKD